MKHVHITDLTIYDFSALEIGIFHPNKFVSNSNMQLLLVIGLFTLSAAQSSFKIGEKYITTILLTEIFNFIAEQ